MKKALALVIGNSSYIKDEHKLPNAANDAIDFSQKLQTLDFDVLEAINVTTKDADRALAHFGEELKKYETGLFFFSGHGLQIKGINYLTHIDNGFQDDYSARGSATMLEEVIERMEDAGPQVKIIILDACRNDPFAGKYRGLNNEGLAPVYAPKGSIIAFSTSPGQKAQDSGAGRNSIYTGAMLQHINDRDVPIEDFFKRVRTTVHSLSAKKQTPWEHTSLIGNVYLNSGQMIQSLSLPYKPEHIADKGFVSSGSDIDNIISELKSSNWDTQNRAIARLQNLYSTEAIDNSSLFLLGRNILQAAVGDSGKAVTIIETLDRWLPKHFPTNYTHVLNGILFEIYFGPDGKFRNSRFKDQFLDQIFVLERSKLFRDSFDFIAGQLNPHRDRLFYIPSNPPVTLAVEVVVEVINPKESQNSFYQLKTIKYQGLDIMPAFKPSPLYGYELVDKSTLDATIARGLITPAAQLTLRSWEKCQVPQQCALWKNLPVCSWCIPCDTVQAGCLRRSQPVAVAVLS